MDTLATKCQYINIERFILQNDCFKLGKNAKETEQEKVFFEFFQSSVINLISLAPAILKKMAEVFLGPFLIREANF